MKIFSRAIAAIMLMVTAVVFAGCIKEDDNVNPSQVVNVNPEYVPIDWEITTVVSSDDSAGTYQIQFNGTVPDIHPGSIIAIDRDTVVLYRFVTSANVSGNTMSVTSAEAYLTDIFANTEFSLSTGNPSKAMTNGQVFYPVAAYVMDDDGTYRTLDMNSKGETYFTHNLWNFEYNNDGYVLYSGSNYSIYMEKMNLDLSLDMVMYMNFGGRDVYEVVDDAIDRYRSRTMKVSAALVGTFNTEQKVRCDVEGNFSYAPDYDLWKHNLFRPIPIKFLAGGVPIVLTLRCDLFRQVEASGSGTISAYTGFSDHTEGLIGFEWQRNGGINPLASLGNTFNFIPPTLEGKGQVQAKVWAFPRVSVMLYDAVGPSFDFMPYLADTVRGGFREQMLGTSNDYCAWSLDCHTGLDLRAGLSLRFFGFETGNYPTPKWNAIDKRLYHSPKKVVHSSGRPAVGRTGTVRFNVYDRNYLTNADVLTPLPQIVKFEANGQLSSEYGIAHNGTASVNWTPTANDILYAKLYDQDGNIIAWDTVVVRGNNNNPDEPYFPTTTWVDLGLPSGLLWASHNVGASSITGYGYYYAWGEIQPKSVYTDATYQHFRLSDDHSWIIEKYNSIDGLTILEPEDDAATVNWGGGARTPTKEEWDELINHTTIRWHYLNGVSGLCCTGTNGNSIFIPAAGSYGFDGCVNAGFSGRYWSSTLSESTVSAWSVYFYSGYHNVVLMGRTQGFPVRPVL